MSTPSDDGMDPELRKYAPKWSRERPEATDLERQQYVNLPKEEQQDRRIRSLVPEGVPELPARREDGFLGVIERFVRGAAFAIVVASLAIFGEPLLQRVGLLEPDSPPIQLSKPAHPRLTANDAPAHKAVVPAPGSAAAPVAASSATAQTQQVPLSPAQGQQAALSPISKPLGQENSVSSAVRGVTSSEIRFGISAPFTGPAKELGQHMKQGIEAAFNVANAKGGVYGRH